MSETYRNELIPKESVNMFYPHGYFISMIRPELNFHCVTKRAFLSECIRQIYTMLGYYMPIVPHYALYNPYYIWTTLNALMAPVEISEFQAKVDKVKRRLFQETKLRPRKINNNIRNNAIKTECFYYKHQRSELGTRKIPRNYLDDARHQVYAELRQKLKRKHMDDDDDDDDDDSDYSDSFNSSTEEGESPQVHSKKSRYSDNLAPSHSQHKEMSMEEQIRLKCIADACRINRRAEQLEEVLLEKQYQERLKANKNTSEAAIRSMLYLLALRGIIMSRNAEDQ